ncbi:MAG: lipopolysaccharide biosynthesis protein [Rhodothermales bacterium]|nr:lipopolysaccharide biosynthesis protein [Rhodothermales bacterium]
MSNVPLHRSASSVVSTDFPNARLSKDGETPEEALRVQAYEMNQSARIRTFGWDVLRDLVHYRWKILGFALVSAVLAAGVSLLMPNEYTASARLLMPDQSTSLLTAFLGGQRSVAARFLGGGASSGYTRPLAILTSRGVYEAVRDSFDLVRIYEIEPGPTAELDALRELQERATFGVDEGYEYLDVSVKDRSPQRAAAMANYFVQLLNRRSSELSSQTASEYRSFVEKRYDQANRSLDSLLDAVRAFQQRHGVIDLEIQAQASFAQIGQLRAEQARLQVQLQGLRETYGPEASEVLATQEALREATRLYEAALNGQDQVFPVARGQVPALVREYAELERERVLQKSVLETLTPMVEAARMEQMRQVEVVQVVDLAVPPARKSEPRRTIIVLTVGLSALLLGVAAVLLYGQYRRHRSRLRRLLNEPVEEGP